MKKPIKKTTPKKAVKAGAKKKAFLESVKKAEVENRMRSLNKTSIIPKKETAKVPGKQAVNKVKKAVVKHYTMSSVAISPEEIVKTLKGKKGTWNIYKNTRVFTDFKPDGKIKGKEQRTDTFGTRLTANNGNILCGNTGFNTLQAAQKNIAAVKASA